MKLSNQNIFNLRGCKNFGGWCQMPLGVCANNFWGGAPHPTAPHPPPPPPPPPQKICACFELGNVIGKFATNLGPMF